MGGASGFTEPLLILIVVGVIALRLYLRTGKKDKLKDSVKRFKDSDQ